MNSTAEYDPPIIFRTQDRVNSEAFGVSADATVQALKAGKSKSEALRLGHQAAMKYRSSLKQPPKK